MKDSNFGQGKKVPPQFHDYLQIWHGLEDIVQSAFNQVEQRLLLEYRDFLANSKQEQIRAEQIVKEFVKEQRKNAAFTLDKFDLHMTESFEQAYYGHKRQAHYRQLKIQQKRNINFSRLDVFDDTVFLKQLKLDFDDYIDSFISELKEQINSQSNKEDKRKSLQQINEKMQNLVEQTQKFIDNQL